MWLDFQTAASVSVASTTSAPRPMLARCWLTSATTCCAYDGFEAGQPAPSVQEGVAPSAGAELCSAGTAAATRPAAIAAATKTRALGTRRLCAVSESVKRPLSSDRSTQELYDSERKEGVSGGISGRGCRITNTVNAALRVVRGACPHDCPDTCALLVEVDEAGRATSIKGNADHPITAGFLCGKVSNYLERVYSDDRLLRPLVRTGAKGEGRFRAGQLGRGARHRRARPAGRHRAARRRVRRPLQLPRDAGPRAGRRDGEPPVRRDGRLDARAHHLRECRGGGHDGDQRRLARGRPRGVGARAHDRRVGLEPALDGAAPLEAHPRGAPPRRTADRRRSVPQPYGARRRRAPAAAAGHRRRARARRHARAARCGPRRRGVVPRARARIRRAFRAPRGRDRRAARGAVRRSGRGHTRVGAGARTGSAVADPPGRRRAAPRRRTDRVPHDRLHPRARGLLAAPRRRALVHSHRHVRRAPGRSAWRDRICVRSPPARSTCRASARRSPTRRWIRPWRR